MAAGEIFREIDVDRRRAGRVKINGQNVARQGRNLEQRLYLLLVL